MDRQRRPLDKLFAAAGVVANMWADAAVNALCWQVRERQNKRQGVFGAYRAGRDHYVSQRASRMCCTETASQAPAQGPQLAADMPWATCQASAGASRGEPWERAPCWRSAQAARELRPWRSGKGKTRSWDRNSATAQSRGESSVGPSGVAGGVEAGAAGGRAWRRAEIDVDRARL